MDNDGGEIVVDDGGKGQINRPTDIKKRTIDICTLSEDELLGMLRGFISSMCSFALSTRNVHKELKETLAKSDKILTQYTYVINRERNKAISSRTTKSAETQRQMDHDIDRASKAVCTKDAYTDTPCWWQIPTMGDEGNPGSPISTAVGSEPTWKFQPSRRLQARRGGRS